MRREITLQTLRFGTDERFTLTKSGRFYRCRLCGRLFSNETFAPKHLHDTIYCAVTGIQKVIESQEGSTQ